MANDSLPIEPGLPALKAYLSQWQAYDATHTVNGQLADTLDSKRDLIAYLAIPRSKAAELFGWGRRTDVVPLQPGIEANSVTSVAKVRERVKGSTWTQEQKDQLLQDFRDRTENSDTKKQIAVAKLWGLTLPSVKKQLRSIKQKNGKAGSMGAIFKKLTGKR